VREWCRKKKKKMKMHPDSGITEKKSAVVKECMRVEFQKIQKTRPRCRSRVRVVCEREKKRERERAEKTRQRGEPIVRNPEKRMQKTAEKKKEKREERMAERETHEPSRVRCRQSRERAGAVSMQNPKQRNEKRILCEQRERESESIQ